MLHSSYNQNHQSQWSRVQTRHYRDEKSHRINLGQNNIFVFCSHMESHKNMSYSNVCWRKNKHSPDKQTAGLKTTKYIFIKGRQCRPCKTFTTEPPNCTVLYWHEQYLEVQTCNSIPGKKVKPNFDVTELTRARISSACTFYVTFMQPQSCIPASVRASTTSIGHHCWKKCELSGFKTDITTKKQPCVTGDCHSCHWFKEDSCQDLNMKLFLFDEIPECLVMFL